MIAKSDKLISIVTKLAEDVHILKYGKRVLVATTSLATATPSYENTPNMLTNDGYWYNSNEGDGVPNDGNDGHTHSSPANEDNSPPMEMDGVVGIIGEVSDASVAIKAPIEGKYKGGGKANSENDYCL